MERIRWMDTFKGLGIILVILGHESSLTSTTTQYIFNFHMPLFFFASGYLFTLKRYPKFVLFLLKKAKTLLIPYVAFSIIAVVADVVLGNAGFKTQQTISQFLLSTRNQIWYDWALWFLTTLFVVEIVYYWLNRILRKPIFVMILVICLTFSAQAILNRSYLPWTIDSVPYFLIYFSVGNVLKTHRWDRNNVHKYVLAFCVVFEIVELAKTSELWRLLYFTHNTTIVGMIETAIALTNILAFVALAKLMDKSKPLAYIGVNSLVIFGLHLPIGFNLLNQLMSAIHLSTPVNNNAFSIVYAALVVAIMFPVVHLINQYSPWIKGEFQNLRIQLRDVQSRQSA